VVADACGGSTNVSRDLALRHMEAAGARMTSWIQVLLELQRDWTRHNSIVCCRLPQTTRAYALASLQKAASSSRSVKPAQRELFGLHTFKPFYLVGICSALANLTGSVGRCHLQHRYSDRRQHRPSRIGPRTQHLLAATTISAPGTPCPPPRAPGSLAAGPSSPDAGRTLLKKSIA